MRNRKKMSLISGEDDVLICRSQLHILSEEGRRMGKGTMA